jgi:hypothetical protein
MCDGDGGGYGGGDYGPAVGSGEAASAYAGLSANSPAVGQGEAATPAGDTISTDNSLAGYGDSGPAIVMAALNGIAAAPSTPAAPAPITATPKSTEAYEKEKASLRRNRRTTILASAGTGLGGKSTLLGQ